jgi:hypothetical protein
MTGQSVSDVIRQADEMMCLVSETTRDHIEVAQRGEYLISGFVPLGSFPALKI